ncbi:polysaccharide deacetylase family protein [Brachybacterium muris]|uniref:NodB homology domain-containing protein n=1 Tax=Brachybacterium muris UCD-AY4 TaxID=1249481 RepID=A0A022L1L5_9MICO|nr:polysaccharide deacetylase family protein [Brachybacterium muris]EYT51267.1 hypothetical protein D641_0100910 [Brachybacterium muris UCD-AY4]
MLRSSAIGACTLGAGAVLSACTGDRSWPDTGSDGGGASGGDPGAGRKARTSAPPGSQQIARTLVTTLEEHSSLVRDLQRVDLSGTLGAPVTYPRPAGARGLAEALDVTTSKLLRESRFRDAGKGAAPTVSARMIVSAASVLGVLLDVVDADGPSVAAVWHRAEGDRAVTSPALIRSEQWGELVERAWDSARSVPGLDVEGTIAQLQEQPRPWGNGPAIIPDADGALRLLFPAAPYAKGHGEALVEVPAAHGATLLSELGKQIRAAIAEPDEFDPGQVTVPMPEDHHGEDSYDPDEPVTPAHPARETSSPGPRTQLAPLAEPGTAPSAVTAPDARRLRTVSLTFDDGPRPELNETLRSHLTAQGAAATFFFIGQSVKAAPKPCAATAADGHEIGGHSWSHADLSRASDERLEREMDRTTRVITEVTGRPPSHMRPPYGAVNSRVDRQAGVHQQSLLLWSVDSLDWKHRDVDRNLQEITTQCTRGAIVLMHEIHKASVATVPPLLDWFREHDYTLLTCCELGQNQLYAGKTYSRGPAHREA